MIPLNYHHLRYFWTVARLGSITRATEELHLTQPGISTQLRTLERSLGEQLFSRSGRTLTLTETGRMVFRYADEIFTTGRELQETLAGRPAGRPSRLTVGVVDALPKLLTYRLLEPAGGMTEQVRLVLREDKPERLLADLAIHALDLVLSDAPVPATIRVRAHSHLLGESGITIFGARSCRGASPPLSALAGGSSLPGADGQQRVAPIARHVVRAAAVASARGCGDRGQRGAQGVRAARARPLRGALGARA